MHTWFTNKAILAWQVVHTEAFTGTVVESSNQVSNKTLSWQEAHVDHIQSGWQRYTRVTKVHQDNKGTARCQFTTAAYQQKPMKPSEGPQKRRCMAPSLLNPLNQLTNYVIKRHYDHKLHYHMSLLQ